MTHTHMVESVRRRDMQCLDYLMLHIHAGVAACRAH